MPLELRHEFGSQQIKSISSKCFGEDVSKLSNNRYMLKMNVITNNFLTFEMKINFNMFCSSMKDRIMSKLNC